MEIPPKSNASPAAVADPQASAFSIPSAAQAAKLSGEPASLVVARSLRAIAPAAIPRQLQHGPAVESKADASMPCAPCEGWLLPQSDSGLGGGDRTILGFMRSKHIVQGLTRPQAPPLDVPAEVQNLQFARPDVDIFKDGEATRETLARATELLAKLSKHRDALRLPVLVELEVDGKHEQHELTLQAVGDVRRLTVLGLSDALGEGLHEVPLDLLHQAIGAQPSDITDMAWRLQATARRTGAVLRRYQAAVVDVPVKLSVKAHAKECEQVDLRLRAIASLEDQTVLCVAQRRLRIAELKPVPRPKDWPAGTYYKIPVYLIERRARLS